MQAVVALRLHTMFLSCFAELHCLMHSLPQTRVSTAWLDSGGCADLGLRTTTTTLPLLYPPPPHAIFFPCNESVFLKKWPHLQLYDLPWREEVSSWYHTSKAPK